MTHQENVAYSTDFSAQQWKVLSLILVSYCMIILDVSIIISGLPEIAQEFAVSAVTLSWVQSAYTLAFGGFLLLGARLGDMLGRKRAFMVGLVLFTIASFAIGSAMNFWVLVSFRVLQGMGAAILAPSTLALLTRYFPHGHARTKALAYYAAAAGIGSSLGLVLGGIFAGWLSWRVGFYVNVPIGLGLLAFGALNLEVDTQQRTAFDLPGALLSTIGMTGVVYGIVESAQFGWSSPGVFLPVLLGVGCLFLFIQLQKQHRSPLLPLSLFSDAERLGAYLARMCFLGAMVSFFFFTTQLMQTALNFTPVEAGLGFLPMTIPTFLASVMVPKLTRKIGNTQTLMVAMTLMILGMAWLSVINENIDYFHQLFFPMVLIGLGNGAALGPLTVSGVANVNPSEEGAASGVVNVAHQLGGTLGLSFLVVVFSAAQHMESANLVQSFHYVYLAASGLLVMGLAFVCWLIPRHPSIN